MNNQKTNHYATIGDVTMIYEDPISRQKPEGLAKLVKLIHYDDVDGFNRWIVIFIEEPKNQYERVIFTGDSIL